MSRTTNLALFLAAFMSCGTTGVSRGEDPWVLQNTGTNERLRGLGAVNADVAWASGTHGTWLLTTDGGSTWKRGVVPGGENLDFRDLHAVDSRTAYLLSSGMGELSRIYKTTDGGLSWTLQITNPDPKGFWDALAFLDSEHGLAFGDPVDGKFVLFETENGGRTWNRLRADSLPPALEGEGAFAASGTCLTVGKAGRIAFATGGAKVARVFRSDDAGKSWSVHDTPIRAGIPSAGIFSLAFNDAGQAIAVGGDYKSPDDASGVAAISSDLGKSWGLIAAGSPGGYRSAVAFRGGTDWVAVGPAGSDRSVDRGKSWEKLGNTGFDSVVVAGDGAVWASGERGRVAKLR